MYCPVCNQPNPDDALYCQYCRTQLQQNDNKKKNGNQSMVIIAVALTLVIVVSAVFAVLILLKDKTKTEKTTEEVTEAVTEANTTAPAAAASTEPTTSVIRNETTSTVTVSTLAPYTQPTAVSTTVSSWQNAPANQLYRPPQSSFLTSRYQAYVYCTDSAVQNYVKMRYGPSSTSFNTVGTPVPNYEIVTVETSPVNGWVLCYYANSATEGWIRSDYLFRDASKLPGTTTTTTTTTPSNEGLITHRDNGYDYVRGGYYRVVTGDGDPLRLRQDPNLNGRVLYNIPEGTIVLVEDKTYYVNGWVYVKFEQNGYHEGFVYFQYLKPTF